ncbi:competence protein ComEA [Deinococcus piscis]|uniref:Competence protein ComEA n=1 Tax=Deinococcus piscis TaxID=394230 RepID=A0ABQ3K2M0_9DEIO|nr:helix-hairpin-helix domain-containing protein [Deinococcus piscis]GHG00556.1 competence protein ComEA [Deinococcus piscis]
MDWGRGEAFWTAVLAAGVLLLATLTLWPLLFPAVRAPQVLRQDPGPLTVTQATGEAAPEYPRTASVEPLISGRLNLNTATREQLEALPEIGPALAGRIEAARPLRSLADLDAVKGIGPATLEQLEPLVKFE